MTPFFFLLLGLVILQRLAELRIAKRNAADLELRGGREFGSAHYPYVVLLHTAYFASLGLEFLLRGLRPSTVWPIFFILFLGAQLGRWWVLRTMGSRWTTRVIVLPGEPLVSRGPFRFLRHPNYVIVMTEIAVLPLVFGLYYTAAIFSILNAGLLLLVRIPTEERALRWAQQGPRSTAR